MDKIRWKSFVFKKKIYERLGPLIIAWACNPRGSSHDMLLLRALLQPLLSLSLSWCVCTPSILHGWLTRGNRQVAANLAVADHLQRTYRFIRLPSVHLLATPSTLSVLPSVTYPMTRIFQASLAKLVVLWSKLPYVSSRYHNT